MDSEDDSSDVDECINSVTNYFKQNFVKNKQIYSDVGEPTRNKSGEGAFDLNEHDADVPTDSMLQNELYTIDTKPGVSPKNQQCTTSNNKSEKSNQNLSTEIDPGMVMRSYIDFDKDVIDQRRDDSSLSSNRKLLPTQEPSKLLRDKCIIPADIERKDSLPKYGKNQLWNMRKAAREGTAGKNWFDMPKADMTPELKRDLEVLKMRHILDNKRFYKNNDYKKKALPKFVQVARVIECSADFYSSRIPKKDRKKTIVDELLADTQTMRKNKRRYQDIQHVKIRAGKMSRKHSKRFKKRSR